MSDAEVPAEIVDELYGAPPDEFIARRDARAKELRKTDRATADAVKKLRKPSVSAATVNRLAHEAVDDVEALLAAGEALREAQLGGGDRDAIRSAARDEREAVEALVGQAGKLSPGVLDEVRETLHAAASDDEVRELIRRGVLTEARQAMGLGGFGEGAAGARAAPAKAKAPAQAPPAKAKASAQASAPAKAKAKAKAPATDTAPRRSRAETGREPAETERKRTEAERKAAEAERKTAEAERKKAAKERVKAARAALRDAEKAATAAERERDAAAKGLARAERDAEGAQAEVERRRKELDRVKDG